MLRQKQLEEIKSLRNRLASLGAVNEPNLERHVMLALISGEVPKLKPVGKISETARKRIVNDRYSSRELKFADVFASCNGYDVEMKQFKAYDSQRKAASAKFEKEAEKIMVKALDSEADAAEIMEQLYDACERSGLKSLKPPIFGEE